MDAGVAVGIVLCLITWVIVAVAMGAVGDPTDEHDLTVPGPWERIRARLRL